MELRRLTDRIWISPFDDARDRPTLGYIRGDRISLAVDAGHSRAHVEEFYAALEGEGLPLPHMTVFTHWHWDHTFGAHAVHGLTLANARTQAHLKSVLDNWDVRGGEEHFKNLDEHIALEYGEAHMVVRLADLVMERPLTLDLGGVTARCLFLPSPHTDDPTFVLIPEEGVLFLGDAISGVYPTWVADPNLREEQIQALEGLDFQTAVGGHWEAFSREGLLKALREGIV